MPGALVKRPFEAEQWPVSAGAGARLDDLRVDLEMGAWARRFDEPTIPSSPIPDAQDGPELSSGDPDNTAPELGAAPAPPGRGGPA